MSSASDSSVTTVTSGPPENWEEKKTTRYRPNATEEIIVVTKEIRKPTCRLFIRDFSRWQLPPQGEVQPVTTANRQISSDVDLLGQQLMAEVGLITTIGEEIVAEAEKTESVGEDLQVDNASDHHSAEQTSPQGQSTGEPEVKKVGHLKRIYKELKQKIKNKTQKNQKD